MPAITASRINLTSMKNYKITLFVGILAVVGVFMVGFRVAEKKDDASVVIRKGNAVTTLVNVLTVQPQKADSLMTLLREGTEAVFSKQPGFIAESIHLTKERNKIVLYGQWRSAADIENFRKNPVVGAYIKRVIALAEFESVICDEVSYINAK